MTSEKQCEIARLLTGSEAPDELILNQVATCNLAKKAEACHRIDALVTKHNMPFDKAFPIIKNDFISIASKYKMDAASLFWIYMEWRNKK